MSEAGGPRRDGQTAAAQRGAFAEPRAARTLAEARDAARQFAARLVARRCAERAREAQALPREARALPREVPAPPREARALPREVRAPPREVRAPPERELREAQGRGARPALLLPGVSAVARLRLPQSQQKR